MAGTSTSSTMRSMRVECIIFYVDPKSVGSLNLLEKERVRFPITDEHSSLAVFTKKFAEFAGIKAEAEKRGLGSCVELKLCRLEKGKDGSKAFAINTQEQWDEERPLHQEPITRSVQLTYFRATAFSQEQKGYEELRKLCRQGNEFCREVSSIFNERSKIEQSYADNLNKLAQKAQKTSKDVLGTLKSSWESTIHEMENEAEIHRSFGSQLHDEVSKQVKAFVETQSKTRKAVEAVVDKAYKNFSDKMNDALKAKRSSYGKCKEAEAAFEQLEEAKSGRGTKALSEKDIAKLDSKSKKLADSALKADKEYRELYEKTENARLEWDATMLKFCKTCEKLEMERLAHLRETCSLYSNMLAAVVPQLQQNYENVRNEVWKINPMEDVVTEANTRGEPRGPSEQILYDCYEEDLEIPMNHDRRKNGLETKIKMLSDTLEKQKKTKAGVESLFEAYSETPDYCSEEGQQDVATQLEHANAIINSLTASLCKVQGALAGLNGQSKPHVWLMTYIQTTKDKQGMLQSVLRIPLDQVTRVGVAWHDERDTKSDDEFDDFPDPPVLGQCRALYEYKAAQSDELDLLPGDIITLTAKLDGDWWQGELHNKTGVFPASYVEEIQ